MLPSIKYIYESIFFNGDIIFFMLCVWEGKREREKVTERDIEKYRKRLKEGKRKRESKKTEKDRIRQIRRK